MSVMTFRVSFAEMLPRGCRGHRDLGHRGADWSRRHRRYFNIAGITVRLETSLHIDEIPFDAKYASFAVDGPGDDNVILRHTFELPDLEGQDLGLEVYRKPPWAISRKGETWFYLGTVPNGGPPQRVAVFDRGHTRGMIYNQPADEDRVKKEGFVSLSLFPTDQIWLAPVLAERRACILHAAGVILDGKGLLFVGHSEAGKSTTVGMLKDTAEILCDDRIIVRRWQDGFRINGTWSHGDVPNVSAASAPLSAILFLQQAIENEIVPLTDRKEVWKRLLAALIRPVVTAEWWQKELDVLQEMVRDVPCYTMRFDKSGAIVERLRVLACHGDEAS